MSMRAVVVSFLTLALAGCASNVSMPSEERQRLNSLLDDISARYAEDEAAKSCLSTSAYRDVEVIDENRLIFWGRQRAWLNDFRRPCRGLRENDTLAFELRDNRVCSLDFVRAIDTSIPVGGAKATCVLGKFKPIEPGQAEAIRELLRADKARR